MTDERHLAEDPLVVRRQRARMGHRDETYVAACRHLAIYSRVISCNVLADIAVERAHRVRQGFDGGVKSPIRPTLKAARTWLRLKDHEAVERAPEIVEPLGEPVQGPPPLGLQELRGVLVGLGQDLQGFRRQPG